MDRNKWISKKISLLVKEGKNRDQAIAQALNMWETMQQGGQIAIDDNDVSIISQGTGITFDPEFAKSYFTKASDQEQVAPIEENARVRTPIDWETQKIVDITSDGQFKDRKIWMTNRPEYFTGRSEAIEGTDYERIPYKKWEDFQNSGAYRNYKNPQDASLAKLQEAGLVTTTPKPTQEDFDLWNNAYNQPNPALGNIFNTQVAPFMDSAYNTQVAPFTQEVRPAVAPVVQNTTIADETISLSQEDLMNREPMVNDMSIYNSKEQRNRMSRNASTNRYDENGNPITLPEEENNQIFNPFGGVSLEGALAYAGQGFGEKDYGKAAVGTSLSFLKGARSFLSPYAAAKSSRETEEQMKRRQFEEANNPTYLAQEGGKISRAEQLTGAFVTDAPNPNFEAEHGEIIKDLQTGEVQKVVGEKHSQGGVGVDKEEAKVLSDYTKVPKDFTKEFEEYLGIKVTTKDTFAKVMDKYNKKVGLNKLIDEEAELIKQVEKKTGSSIPEATRKINEEFLSKKIEEVKQKQAELKATQDEAFEYIFGAQETIPKKSDGTQLLNKDGEIMAKYGGQITELAKKYNISPERAEQLMQEGGQPTQQDPMQEVMQQVAMALQQGVSPEEILQQLLQMGIPQEQAQMILQQVTEPQMKKGGEYAQEGGYSFSTRYKPELKDYETDGISILDQDMLSGVETMQSYTGKGYGLKMADVEQTIKSHNWYFDTDEKKQAFREAVSKRGNQPEVKAFQEAYNKELEKRAFGVGMPKEEVEKIIKEVGFSDKGVQNVDGLFGAFTSTRPLYSFSKKDGQIVAEPTTPQQPNIALEDINQTPDKNLTEEGKKKRASGITLLPQDLLLPPSSLKSIYKGEIALGRLDPTKITPEPTLVELERQRQSASEQAYFLPDQQRAAVLAQMLGQSQAGANEAIGKAEMFNADQQQKADQYNLQTQAKEDLTNLELNKDFERRNLAGQAIYETNLRRFLNEMNDQNRYNFNYIDRRNIANQAFENVSTTGSDVNVSGKPDFSLNMTDKDMKAFHDSLTPEQRKLFKIDFAKK